MAITARNGQYRLTDGTDRIASPSGDRYVYDGGSFAAEDLQGLLADGVVVPVSDAPRWLTGR